MVQPGRRRGPQGDAASSPGELDHFDAFYREHARRMVRLAYLLTGGSGAAEEIVQDAFLQVSQRWATIDHPAAYLRTSVVHAAASHRRRAALELVKGVERRSEAIGESGTDYDDDLRKVIARLPDRQRAAVVLRYFDDLSDADIAVALGCRVPAVKSLLHRALKELREVVEQ